MRNVMLASLVVATAAQADSTVEGAKVFLGGEGAKAIVLTLTPASDKKCLLKLVGTASDFDGKVLPCTIEDNNRGPRYGVVVHGRDWNVAVSNGTGSGAMTLYVAHNKELVVKYDEKASKDLKVDDVVKEHQAQSAANAAFMKFDRVGEQAAADKALAERLGELNKACSSKLTATIKWDGVSDDILKRISVSSYCGSALDAMGSLCKYKAARDVIPAKLSTVSCSWGPWKLDVSGPKTLAVAFDENASNIEQNVTEYLKQNL